MLSTGHRKRRVWLSADRDGHAVERDDAAVGRDGSGLGGAAGLDRLDVAVLVDVHAEPALRPHHRVGVLLRPQRLELRVVELRPQRAQPLADVVQLLLEGLLHARVEARLCARAPRPRSGQSGSGQSDRRQRAPRAAAAAGDGPHSRPAARVKSRCAWRYMIAASSCLALSPFLPFLSLAIASLSSSAPSLTTSEDIVAPPWLCRASRSRSRRGAAETRGRSLAQSSWGRASGRRPCLRYIRPG